MKVAIINIEHPTYIGGRQSYVATLMKYLAKKVENITSISAQPNIDFKDSTFVRSNVKEILLPIPPSHSSFIFFNNFINKSEIALQELCIQEPIDIIHAHGVVDAHAAIKVKKRFNIPLILTIHSPPPPEEDFWLKNIKKHADAVVVLSTYMKRWLINIGYSEKKVFVIPGFIDFELFDPSINANDMAKKLNININDKIIFFPARFSPLKGIHIFLRAMAKVIKEEENKHCKILLTGRGSSPELLLLHKKNDVNTYTESLTELINKLQIWQNIIGEKTSLEYYNKPKFSREEMPQLYKISTVTVYPSLNVPFGEPFGLVVLESMRMMTPIIVSNSGGMTEIIKDGETGLLVPAGDVDALSEKIKILLGNESLRCKIVKNAKKEVLKYDPQLMVNSHIELYENLLKK